MAALQTPQAKVMVALASIMTSGGLYTDEKTGELVRRTTLTGDLADITNMVLDALREPPSNDEDVEAEIDRQIQEDLDAGRI